MKIVKQSAKLIWCTPNPQMQTLATGMFNQLKAVAPACFEDLEDGNG